MKRFLVLLLVYSGVFAVGYITVGIVLHYVKPEVKMLPAFIEDALPDADAPVEAQRQALDGMDYRLLTDPGFDSSNAVYFGEQYGDTNGIFCFRGNARRNHPTRGTLSGKPDKITLDWVFTTDYDARLTEFGVWGGGSGWTGQPLLIRWPEEKRRKLAGILPEFASNKQFCEVIVGSLCGNIYFLDFETGKATRPHMSIGNPIKGTVSVDPRMTGLMTVGQGIPNGGRFGAYLFDLFTGRETGYRSGMDPQSRRLWGAHDSNPLIDPKSGYLIWPAENGQVYKSELTAGFGFGRQQKFNYLIAKHPQPGLEASFGAYKNLGFFGDNGGNIFCLDLTTMHPVWVADNIDDTDASLVVEEENGRPFLYVGNEVDKQGATGNAYIRKVDGLTGKEVWKVRRTCSGTAVGGRANSGGVLATVLPGKKKASGLVFGIFSRVGHTMAGEFVAIDRTTGREIYTIPMNAYSWASPIDLYDGEGNAYLFFTDVYGTIYLVEGLSGKVLYREKTSYIFESSPVAWDNRIVVGTRGKTILSFIVE